VSIHRARRALKTTRALLVLLDASGRRVEAPKSDRWLARISHELGALRDSAVLLGLLEVPPWPLPVAESVLLQWRRRLGAERRHRRRTLDVPALCRSLAAVRQDVERAAPIVPRGRAESGLGLIYRRARRALARVAKHGRSRDLHALRRRTRSYLEILKLLDVADDHFHRPRVQAAEIVELLGDLQDATLLVREIDHFGARRRVRKEAHRLLEKQRARVRRQVLRIGKTLYGEQASTLMKRAGVAWGRNGEHQRVSRSATSRL
jgi:CHAD domain-containing protein